MKGIIFNRLEQMVTESFGLEAWDEIVVHSSLRTPNGVFVGPANYPDEDLFALVGTASRLTGKSVTELVRTFGRFLFRQLAMAYPVFIKPGMSAKAFLLSVDRVIHVEVRKLDSHAALPSIRYEDPAPDQLIMLYSSPRNLCELALGLIEGAAEYFGESVSVEQTACRHQGAAECRLVCTFGKAAV